MTPIGQRLIAALVPCLITFFRELFSSTEVMPQFNGVAQPASGLDSGLLGLIADWEHQMN